MDHYFPIRLIDTTHAKVQPSLVCWQHVTTDDDGANGRHAKFCDDSGLEIVPPAKHEAHHLTYPPDAHHLPGLRLDPAYQPPPMAEFIARAQPVLEAQAAVEAGDTNAPAAFAAARAEYEAWNAQNVARYRDSGQAKIDAARKAAGQAADPRVN